MPTSETACSCLQNYYNANNIIRVRYLTFSAQCYRFLWNQIHSSNPASWIFLNIQTKNEKITKFRISYTLLCRTNSNSMQSTIFKLKLFFYSLPRHIEFQWPNNFTIMMWQWRLTRHTSHPSPIFLWSIENKIMHIYTKLLNSQIRSQ